MFDIFEKIRKEKGLRYTDIARGCGVPVSTFTDWKMGRYTPKVDKLQKIADFLDVPLDFLMTGKVTEGYYSDSKTATIAQKVLESPGRRTLFDITADMPEEDLQKINKFIQEYIIDNHSHNSDS